jgi:hypothetical protein
MQAAQHTYAHMATTPHRLTHPDILLCLACVIGLGLSCNQGVLGSLES